MFICMSQLLSNFRVPIQFEFCNALPGIRQPTPSIFHSQNINAVNPLSMILVSHSIVLQLSICFFFFGYYQQGMTLKHDIKTIQYFQYKSLTQVHRHSQSHTYTQTPTPHLPSHTLFLSLCLYTEIVETKIKGHLFHFHSMLCPISMVYEEFQNGLPNLKDKLHSIY